MSRLTRRHYLAVAGTAALAGCATTDSGLGNYDGNGGDGGNGSDGPAGDGSGCVVVGRTFDPGAAA